MASLATTLQRSTPRVFAQVTKRGMATEKQIFNQIVATKNIKKITASMKMVSAAKLKGDEIRLTKAIPFNSWTSTLCEPPRLFEDINFEDLPQRTLVVPFTSEKGLCGGINSYISRAVRDTAKGLSAAGKECDVVLIGDKGRGPIKRVAGDKIIRSATDVVSPGNFLLASSLAAEIIKAGAADYDGVLMLYNSFKNAAVYEQKYKLIKPFVYEGDSDVTLSTYEFDFDKAESMQDLYEYLLASQIYHSFMDGAASEQSSRMTAMENATKNSGEMIDSLTLKYNRVRQSRITTELIEIISGASALDDK